MEARLRLQSKLPFAAERVVAAATKAWFATHAEAGKGEPPDLPSRFRAGERLAETRGAIEPAPRVRVKEAR